MDITKTAIIVHEQNAVMMKLKMLRYFVFVGFALMQINRTYSQEKTKLTVNELTEGVEVLRDEWGINHIYAKNQHDLFFAQGYLAAKDRLFQFEIWRRQATGTVAEILGERELKRDIGSRLFKYRGDMTTELNHYHPQGVEIVEAYVAGVNAYIDEANAKPEKLPIEFLMLHIKPGKWTPEVVVSRHQGLLGNIADELNTGRAVAMVGAEKVKALRWFHPKEPNITLDSAIDGKLLMKDIIALYNDCHTDVVFKPSDIDTKVASQNVGLGLLNSNKALVDSTIGGLEAEGSNNWIVSGKRTASGHTMLANDPHRKISLPSLRYMVHLVAPGWNVIGGGEPVIPGVSIGHNEYGAWGLTIFATDGEDLFVYDLDPNHLDRYKYKDHWETLKEVKETIPVKGKGETTVSLYYTVHGPVSYIDTQNHKAYAIKCAWLEPGCAPYMASLRIDQARDWESFRKGCTYSNIPGENMVWADCKGNIGWQAVGIAPIRKNFSGMVPVPGDGRYEWDGYLPIDRLPHVYNPEKGYFTTANQNLTPDSYNHFEAIGYTWADPYRADRINEVLGSTNKLTIPKIEALQTDYYSIPARTLVPYLKGISFDDSLISIAQNKLLNWDYVLDKNSIAAGIYAGWEKQLFIDAKNKFVPAAAKPYLNLQMKTILKWVENPSIMFGKDSIGERDSFIKKSFEEAVAALKTKLGIQLEQWQYGQNKYKHVQIEHPLGNIVDDAWKRKLNTSTLPRGGNAFTPGVTGALDNQVVGASFRFITDVGDWDKAMMINTPGQSGNPASKFYANLFPLWANDEYFPAYYSLEKIKEHTVEDLMLSPKK